MSRYFEALNRLRRSYQAASRRDMRLAEETELETGARPEGPAPASGHAFPELQLASRQASYADLLDVLLTTGKPSSVPMVVIAAVSADEAVHEVVAGVQLQARRRGVSLKLGHLDLSTGDRLLNLPSRRPLQEKTFPGLSEGTQQLRLSGSRGSGALGRWLQDAATGCDLLLIEAPPLSSSVDAALVGEACDGLVLVAETLVTDRAALRDGIERARLTGCEILGIVLTGARRWLPRWMSRLVDLFDRA